MVAAKLDFYMAPHFLIGILCYTYAPIHQNLGPHLFFNMSSSQTRHMEGIYNSRLHSVTGYKQNEVMFFPHNGMINNHSVNLSSLALESGSENGPLHET